MFKRCENSKKIIALGYFDSLHIGHRQLIGSALKLASENNLKCACLLLYGNNDIYPLAERKKILKELGVTPITLKLGAKLKKVTARDFLNELVEKRGAMGFVCGQDFRFGNGATAGAEFLLDYSKKRNLLTFVEQTHLTQSGAKISTTMIKELLEDGNISLANEYLQKPYFISGKVVYGNQIGSKLGFPTANVQLTKDIYLKQGVYYGVVQTEYGNYKSIINVGAKPTVEDGFMGIEAHLIDFDKELYGKNITVSFIERIRDIKKFDNLEQLKEQIKSDKESII